MVGWLKAVQIILLGFITMPSSSRTRLSYFKYIEIITKLIQVIIRPGRRYDSWYITASTLLDYWISAGSWSCPSTRTSSMPLCIARNTKLVAQELPAVMIAWTYQHMPLNVTVKYPGTRIIRNISIYKGLLFIRHIAIMWLTGSQPILMAEG